MTVKVKICGLGTSETMTAALDAGVDYVGLVFYGPSPRNIELKLAWELAQLARSRAKVVALTVDPDDELLAAIVETVNPDILQLHGCETVERVAEIGERFGRPVLKAIKIETKVDAARALYYRDVADTILFDAKTPKPSKDTPDSETGSLPGGNGVVFDWSALESIRGKVNFMLSGGLDPNNVAEAIAATGTTSVDVSSGVESAPGVKDIARIRAFIAAAKSA